MNKTVGKNKREGKWGRAGRKQNVGLLTVEVEKNGGDADEEYN